MKAFYLFVYFSIVMPSIALAGNPEWKRVDSIVNLRGHKYYKDIECADSHNCIIHGYIEARDGDYFRNYWDSFLRRTTDGGLTWKDVYRDSSITPWIKGGYKSIEFEAIAYPSTNLVLAVGDSGKVIRSTDKGETWQERSLGKEYIFRMIRMLDDKYGIVYANNTQTHGIDLFTTIDGGESWERMKTTGNYSLKYRFTDFEVIKPGAIIAKCYEYGGEEEYFLIHFYNDWDSIVVHNIDSKMGGEDIHFINENIGWMFGGGPPSISNPSDFDYNQVIYYTNNGGKSWITLRDTFEFGNQLYAGDFFNDRFEITTTHLGYAYFTHNGGKTWERFRIDDSIPGDPFIVGSPQLTSYSSGYVLVSGDYVYKYTRDWSIPHDTSGSPEDSIKSISFGPPDLLNYLTNYPNPFSERTTIVYNLSQAGPMSLSIYDLQGNKIETLKEEFEYEGLHETDFENASLPPGCYYYQLRSGGQVLTRKFIVIK